MEKNNTSSEVNSTESQDNKEEMEKGKPLCYLSNYPHGKIRNPKEDIKDNEVHQIMVNIAMNNEEQSSKDKYLTGEENIIENLIKKYSNTEIKTSEIRNIKEISLKIPKNFNMLNDIGYHMPSLINLNLSGSVILSFDELGISLKNLEILNLSNCQLKYLTGIICFEYLKELDISYNQIQDIFELDMCTSIQILKINNNKISDEDNFVILQTLPALKELYISNNPFVKYISNYTFENIKLDV
ncbi:MAG: hypothetical protein MJ252_07905 [archaeon]|nr:hypothetical protein [archaeon]